MRWTILSAIVLVAVLAFALVYPRIQGQRRERILKGSCDRSIWRRHESVLRDYALSTKRYESELAAYDLAEKQFEQAQKAREAYEFEYNKALLSRDPQKKLGALRKPTEVQRPTMPEAPERPRDAASLPAVGPLAVISLETKASVMAYPPDSTCIQYVRVLLEDPKKSQNERWEIELATRSEPDLSYIENSLSDIESDLSTLKSR